MKRVFTFVAVFMVTALIAVQFFTAAAQEPMAGGTLTAAFQNEWAGLDPHVVSSYSSYQILNNVLESLTFYDDNLNLVPWLAESWEQSEDGLVWTFHLRQGVMFSNGRGGMTGGTTVLQLSLGYGCSSPVPSNRTEASNS